MTTINAVPTSKPAPNKENRLVFGEDKGSESGSRPAKYEPANMDAHNNNSQDIPSILTINSSASWSMRPVETLKVQVGVEGVDSTLAELASHKHSSYGMKYRKYKAIAGPPHEVTKICLRSAVHPNDVSSCLAY
jgi:hypothetical protein